MSIRSSNIKLSSSWRQQKRIPFSSPCSEFLKSIKTPVHHHRECAAIHSAQPGVFEVQDVSPPPQSLGMHAFPPNTHNGDEIEVEGDSYVVQKVIFRFRLIKGKYKPAERRLEVRRTGRFLYNKTEGIMRASDLVSGSHIITEHFFFHSPPFCRFLDHVFYNVDSEIK